MKLKFYAVLAFLMLILGLITNHSITNLSDVSLTSEKNLEHSISLPYLQVAQTDAKLYTFKGTLKTNFLSPRNYRITPNDQVEALLINGLEVDLSVISQENLGDKEYGFAIDLNQYLRSGKNSFDVQVTNFSDKVGLSIQPIFTDSRLITLACLWFILLSFLFVRILNDFGLIKKNIIPYYAVVTGSIAQIFNIFIFNPVDHIYSDSARHWEQGIDVLRTDVMALTDPIIYQIYISVLAKLTLKLPVLMGFYTSILALVTPWLWYKFFRELQKNKTIALYGWASLSILPSWMAIYSYFMQETLLLPLLGAALWATWRCRRKADTASFLLMVFIWLVAGLTRGIAIPMAAVCCTWLWLQQDEKIRKALLSSLILVFILGQLTYRSYQIVHHFSPHGMGHLNEIYSRSGKKEIELFSHNKTASWGHIFGSPSTGTKPFAPFSDWGTQREGVVTIDIDLNKGLQDWKAEKAKIDMSFKDYLWITKENLIFLFFAESWPDNQKDRIVDKANTALRFIWLPLFICVILLLVIHRRKMKGQWMLSTVIIVWFVVQGLIPISVNEGRYRKPFEGLLIAQVLLLTAAVTGMTHQNQSNNSGSNSYLTKIQKHLRRCRKDNDKSFKNPNKFY